MPSSTYNHYAALDTAPLEALSILRGLPSEGTEEELIANLKAQDVETQAFAKAHGAEDVYGTVEDTVVVGDDEDVAEDGGWQIVGPVKKGKKGGKKSVDGMIEQPEGPCDIMTATQDEEGEPAMSSAPGTEVVVDAEASSPPATEADEKPAAQQGNSPNGEENAKKKRKRGKKGGKKVNKKPVSTVDVSGSKQSDVFRAASSDVEKEPVQGIEETTEPATMETHDGYIVVSPSHFDTAKDSEALNGSSPSVAPTERTEPVDPQPVISLAETEKVESIEEPESTKDIPAAPKVDEAIEDADTSSGPVTPPTQSTWEVVKPRKTKKSAKPAKPAPDSKPSMPNEESVVRDATMPGDKTEDFDATAVETIEEVLPAKTKKNRKRGKKGGKKVNKSARVSHDGDGDAEVYKLPVALFVVLLGIFCAWLGVWK